MWTGLRTSFLSIGNFFVRWSFRLTKYFKHRIMSKRKNILLFAEHDSKLYQQMHAALKNSWEITRIYTKPKESSTVQQTNSPKTTEIEVSTPQQPSFYKEYFLDNNYDQLEKILQGRQFDSIAVLPHEDDTVGKFNFEDQRIAVDYLEQHQRELMRNLFSYRIATKNLTTSGVLILSASQRDFLKAEPEQIRQQYQNKQWAPSVELIDAQVTYLGVVTGQRDYTDLNSWCLVALSRQWIPQNVQFVSKNYCNWALNYHLPMPGSFALFKRKTATHPTPFLEYL